MREARIDVVGATVGASPSTATTSESRIEVVGFTQGPSIKVMAEETDNKVIVQMTKLNPSAGPFLSTVPSKWTHMPGEALPSQLSTHCSAQMWDEFLTRLTSRMDAAKYYTKFGVFTVPMIIVGTVFILVRINDAMRTVGTVFFIGAIVYQIPLGILSHYRMKPVHKQVFEEWEPKFATAGLKLELQSEARAAADGGSYTVEWLAITTPSIEQATAEVPVVTAVVVGVGQENAWTSP